MKYFIIIAILFASCTSLPKKIQKARETLNANPPAGALYCAETFPAKDSMILGDTIIVTDTLWGAGSIDTVITKDTVRITKTLPAKEIVKTKTIRDTIIRVDRAAVDACSIQLGQTNELNAKLIKENDDLKAFKASMRGKVHIPIWIIILLGVALAGWTFWRIKAGALNKVISKLK